MPDGARDFKERGVMPGFICKLGEKLPEILDALWCQAYLETTKKQPYEVDGHYSIWDWFDTGAVDPSYYTVEPFDDCRDESKFDSWFGNNYARAVMCRDALTRLGGLCYDARPIGTNWFGNRYYQVVRSTDPEPSPYCEFMLARAAVDAQLWR